MASSLTGVLYWCCTAVIVIVFVDNLGIIDLAALVSSINKITRALSLSPPTVSPALPLQLLLEFHCCTLDLVGGEVDLSASPADRFLPRGGSGLQVCLLLPPPCCGSTTARPPVHLAVLCSTAFLLQLTASSLVLVRVLCLHLRSRLMLQQSLATTSSSSIGRHCVPTLLARRPPQQPTLLCAVLPPWYKIR